MQTVIVLSMEHSIFWKNEKGHVHRLDGPAQIFYNGVSSWYVDGRLHRADGPAIIYSDGFERFYLHGVGYAESDYYSLLQDKRQES